MHAEIVVTGSEIVLGKLVDTNSAYLATQLQHVGIPLHYIAAVGDDEQRMTEVLRIALARSPLIITTGGLGPTVDDVTRDAVAAATGRPLVFDAALLEQIAAHFARFGRAMSENNRKQALLPSGALPIENPVGTAPAYIVERDGGALISLPGVPREMTYLMENAVLPYLRTRFGGAQIMRSRTLHTAGMGESLLDARLGDAILRSTNPQVGLNARAGQVDVRLTATGPDEESCAALIAGLEAAVRARLGAAIFGIEDETLEGVLVQALAARGLRVATAEAGTRGQLAGRLAGAAGAEAVFAGGYVGVTGAGLLAALARTLGPSDAPPDVSDVDADPEATARALSDAVRRAAGAGVGLSIIVQAEPLRVIIGLARDEGV